jgi:hypothetical protein
LRRKIFQPGNTTAQTSAHFSPFVGVLSEWEFAKEAQVLPSCKVKSVTLACNLSNVALSPFEEGSPSSGVQPEFIIMRRSLLAIR